MRKSVKKIAAIRREVDEVERRILREEALESMKKDPKERLRVNETLMSLLFKLDSVRGVDLGVRDCRKSVIKRAIALQEFLDSIVADGQTLTLGGEVDEASDSSEIGEKEGKVSESKVEISATNSAKFVFELNFLGLFCVCFLRKYRFMGLLEIGLFTGFMGLICWRIRCCMVD